MINYQMEACIRIGHSYPEKSSEGIGERERCEISQSLFEKKPIIIHLSYGGDHLLNQIRYQVNARSSTDAPVTNNYRLKLP